MCSLTLSAVLLEIWRYADMVIFQVFEHKLPYWKLLPEVDYEQNPVPQLPGMPTSVTR